jgi:hypothetical protein
MKNVLLYISLIISLEACSTWPPYGHSGAAEQMPYTINITANHTRLSNTKHELDRLHEMGVNDHLPAAMEIVSIQWGRAVRAVEGGFPKAANADLDNLEMMVLELQAALFDKLTFTTGQIDGQQSVFLP